MKITFSIFLLSLSLASYSQTTLAPGEQPQMTQDVSGTIRVVYGEKDKIFFSVSNDNGKTFSAPQLVAQVAEMHLGMTRGPQLATSKDYSMITAMDKVGNIHTFRQNHKTGTWEKIQNVNDVAGSAPEGLMSLSADENNNFYAVWLDLREDKKNNICFASLKGNQWSANKFVYKSPDGHVCECCKPSVAAKGKTISIMFRNWLKGSRDLYLITSLNGGASFSEAQKLGTGTWPLKGCPMDGGGLTIDSKNIVHTAWQRDGIVYAADLGKAEEKLGEGRSVSMSGNFISWQKDSELIVRMPGGDQQKIGDGTALKVFQLNDKSIFAIWEKEEKIVFKKL